MGGTVAMTTQTLPCYLDATVVGDDEKRLLLLMGVLCIPGEPGGATDSGISLMIEIRRLIFFGGIHKACMCLI